MTDLSALRHHMMTKRQQLTQRQQQHRVSGKQTK